MTVASASRPRSVFGSARTLWPSLSRRSTTPFQLEESAHAPWTSKIVGFVVCASVLLVDIKTIADVRPSAHAKAGNRDRNSLMSTVTLLQRVVTVAAVRSKAFENFV